MLTKQEINNTRVFLKRVRDITGEESLAHALCLQAMDREEQAVSAAERNAKIAAAAAQRAKEEAAAIEVTGQVQ